MMTFILGIVLLLLALAMLVLFKTYSLVPAREIKRKARTGDTVATTVYRAVAFGPNLRVLLEVLLTVFGVLSLACLSSVLGLWWAILVMGVVSAVVVFVFVPSGDL